MNTIDALTDAIAQIERLTAERDAALDAMTSQYAENGIRLWKSLAKLAERDLAALRAERDGLRAANSHDALITALKEAREYFAERADADQPHGYDHSIGNTEMALLVEIDAALAKAGVQP